MKQTSNKVSEKKFKQKNIWALESFILDQHDIINGSKKDQKIRINFLTQNDCGKKLFVNVVKLLANEYSSNEIKSINEIDSNLINNRING